MGQDQPQAMTEAEVSEGLGLDTLKGRQWAIYKSCAIKGEGLETGLDWCGLSFPIPLKRKLIRSRYVQAGTIIRHKVTTSLSAVYMHLLWLNMRPELLAVPVAIHSQYAKHAYAFESTEKETAHLQ